MTTPGADAADRMTFVLGSGVIDGTGTGLRPGEGVLIRAGLRRQVNLSGMVISAKTFSRRIRPINAIY